MTYDLNKRLNFTYRYTNGVQDEKESVSVKQNQNIHMLALSGQFVLGKRVDVPCVYFNHYLTLAESSADCKVRTERPSYDFYNYEIKNIPVLP